MSDRLGDITYVDGWSFCTAAAIAILVELLTEEIAHMPVFGRWLIAIVLFFIAFGLYMWARAKSAAMRQDEIKRRRRFHTLEQAMLSIASEFLKACYIVNDNLAAETRKAKSAGELTAPIMRDLLEVDRGERRTHITAALKALCMALAQDDFKRPADPDAEVQDEFKVSYYAVESFEEELALRPKWRCYPNEGQPTTQKFGKNEGASGRAWATKKVVVCELGSEDPIFVEMWSGQSRKYASMVCVPVIKDIPATKTHDVLGVLTIDSAKRRGYFEKSLDDFWESLFNPICNVLVYSHEAENVKEAMGSAVVMMSEAGGQSVKGTNA